MFVKIRRSGGAQTEGVHLWTREAIKIVEDHGAEWRAEIDQLGRRIVKLPSFIIGADDKNAHVELVRGFNGRPIQIVHKVPMHVHVIESAALNGLKNEVRGGMGRKTDKPSAPFSPEFARGLQTAVGLESIMQVFPIIDAMKGEQIDIVKTEVCH